MDDSTIDRVVLGHLQKFGLVERCVPVSDDTLRVALAPPKLLKDTNPFSKKYAPGCALTHYTVNRTDKTFEMEVKCTKPASEGPWLVTGYWDDTLVTGRVVKGNASKLNVFLRCGCPAWVWWSAEYWAYSKKFLNPPVRGKIKAPTEREDLRNRYFLCKHAYIAMEAIRVEILSLKEKPQEVEEVPERTPIKKPVKKPVRKKEEERVPVRKPTVQPVTKKPVVKPEPKTKSPVKRIK